MDYSDIELKRIRDITLEQMACEYRNSPGTLRLAEMWGYSKEDLTNLLRKCLEEYERKHDAKKLASCYDIASGKYLGLREWIEKRLELHLLPLVK